MDADTPEGLLPCAVQVGFAGARRLYPPDATAPSDALARPPAGELAESLAAQLAEQLTAHLRALPAKLGLAPHQFLCGISQVAVGADFAFTAACRALDLPQRIFLPQPADVYVTAVGADGSPDFQPDERTTALALLAGLQVIEHRVVTTAPTRHQRFEEVNQAIAAHSDVVICLLREGSTARPGGTAQLLDLARQRGIPVLLLVVSVRDGQVQLAVEEQRFDQFEPPRLPAPLDRMPAPECAAACDPGPAGTGRLPSVQQFATSVKAHYSSEAARQRRRFGIAAWLIIGTHLLATLCATVVLAAHGHGADDHHDLILWPLALLLVELIALGIGFAAHQWLHQAAPSRNWALARLLAEINRSVRALGNLHLPLDYLFRLRLPAGLDPLLRTLDILHLHSTRAQRDQPSGAALAAYLHERLRDPDPKKGQIAYYRDRSRRERRRLRASHWTFLVCSGLAMLATALKLVTLGGLLPLAPDLAAWLPGLLGGLAVMLPVLAVGALSWAAAQDYEGRVHSFDALATHLERAAANLDCSLGEPAPGAPHAVIDAGSARRAIEGIEKELLGETAEWYTRRTFGKVA